MMNNTAYLTLAIVFVALAGCGDVDPVVVGGEDGEDPAVAAEEVIEEETAECSDCEFWEIRDPGESIQAQHFCEPSAPEWEEEDRLTELEQEVWNGDRLERRVYIQRIRREDVRLEAEWTYDADGRLTEVTTKADDVPVARSVWSYENGQPASVDRRIGGISIERQSWEYDRHGLAARHVETGPEHADVTVPEELRRLSRHTVHVHDSYARAVAHPPAMSYENPAINSNIHLEDVESGDCVELPSAPGGHGYPLDENAYHLGLDADHDNIGLTYDYGYAGYMPGKWYGHLGVATAWPSENYIYGWRGHEVEAGLEYDEEGRMVRERIEFRPSVNDETVVVERTRSFASIGLVADQIDVVSGSKSGTAELRFDRNEGGDLLSRTRYRNDELVAVQDWSYGDDGVAERLDVYLEKIENVDGTPAYYYGVNPSPDVLLYDTTSTMFHAVTYVREDGEPRRL